MDSDKTKLINMLKIISPFLIGLGSVMILLTIWNSREGLARIIFIILGCLCTLAGVFGTSTSIGLSKKTSGESPRK